eukprot:1793964-Alexandrium_andersonii.AAC.1
MVSAAFGAVAPYALGAPVLRSVAPFLAFAVQSARRSRLARARAVPGHGYPRQLRVVGSYRRPALSATLCLGPPSGDWHPLNAAPGSHPGVGQTARRKRSGRARGIRSVASQAALGSRPAL